MMWYWHRRWLITALVVWALCGLAIVSVRGQSAPAPANGVNSQIVFSGDFGMTNIYIMKPDGTHTRQLETYGKENHSPSCSPDGERIVFTNHFDGEVQVIVMNADGSGRKVVAGEKIGNSYPNYAYPVWSPDGTQIIYASNPRGVFRDGDYDIFIMDTDGFYNVRLIDNEVNDSDLAWSPDGEWLAFSLSHRVGYNVDLGRNEFNQELYIIRPDGSDRVQLTDHPARDTEPAWSPDGTKIAFASDRDGDTDIYVMDIARGRVVQLTRTGPDVHDTDPVWSPDGSQIAFASNRHGDGEHYAIYVMDANGGNQRLVTDESLLYTSSFSPCWLNAPPMPWLTVENAEATEGDAIRFTVALDMDAPGSFTVDYTIATTVSAAETDLGPDAPLTGTLTFAGHAGEQHTINLPSTDDTEVENEEFFFIQLTDIRAIGDFQIGLNPEATSANGYIIDNDSPTQPSPTPP